MVKKIIDAISSWWCKSLGHNHPRLKEALFRQANLFEHVIFANTLSKPIIKLSEKLTNLTPHLKKIFYAGDGSCAVEVAMKMSIHARVIEGKTKKTKFIALENGYHGETAAALSVSDVGIYKDAYQSILFKPTIIKNIPYVSGKNDPLWHNAEEAWQKIKPQLEKHIESTTAIIFEPIIQGAGGMLIYSPDFLNRLANWAQQNDIHLIADEIMTGIARTGKMLGIEHANIHPDFICLSKGLTSGFMPFSAVLTTNNIYNLFYDDYEKGKSFLHSHTFSGNPLGAAIALEALKIIEDENIIKKAQNLNQKMMTLFSQIAKNTGKIHNIRSVGGMIAGDLKTNNPKERLGFKLYQIATKEGILLRPLGNTIYWLPPLNISDTDLEMLSDKTERAILKLND